MGLNDKLSDFGQVGRKLSFKPRLRHVIGPGCRSNDERVMGPVEIYHLESNLSEYLVSETSYQPARHMPGPARLQL
ncbi:unnamed protein product [Caenorhabditis nigoni]